MKISKVVLNNFAQHKKVEHVFHENIIGILGKNGSGKSNFAFAISVAVTGEFGKKKKKDLISEVDTETVTRHNGQKGRQKERIIGSRAEFWASKKRRIARTRSCANTRVCIR